MAVRFKDYYEVLGVAKDAPHEDIRKAFRKLAMEHHPDVAKDKKTSEARFREINDAYEVLGDPEKRKKYDQFRSVRNGGGGGAGGRGRASGGWSGMRVPEGEDYESFNEFFDAFMGGAQSRGGSRRQRGEGVARPQIVEAEVHVTVEEILNGARKRVTVRLPGSATGEAVEVGVPAGTVPGQKIRLKGRGLNGGDLHLKTVLLPHASYSVDGSDLLVSASVPVSTAVLGGSLEVRTPDGVVRLKVPAGTQPGRKFRLGGHGLPMPGKKRGNFIVEVRVAIPESLTLDERACWVKLEELRRAR